MAKGPRGCVWNGMGLGNMGLETKKVRKEKEQKERREKRWEGTSRTVRQAKGGSQSCQGSGEGVGGSHQLAPHSHSLLSYFCVPSSL